MTALAASKPREFLAGVPELDVLMPLKATTQVYAGSFLMFSSGAVAPNSGAGVFAGVCMETALGGAADGDVLVKVRVMGGLRTTIVTDATALSNIGVAATVPECTDDNDIRIETGSAITGALMGKFLRIQTVGAAGTGLADILFKGAQVL